MNLSGAAGKGRYSSVSSRAMALVYAVALSDIVALSIAILFHIPDTELYAQESSSHVLYHGVPLPVDERLLVGGELLKIALFGEAFLVSPADAPRQVVLRYIKHAKIAHADFKDVERSPRAQHGISNDELRSVALAAAQKLDSQVLQAVAVLGVTAQAAQAFSSQELWRHLVINTEMRAKLWLAVDGVRNHAITQRLCLAGAAVVRAEGEPQLVAPKTAPNVAQRGYVSPEVAELCIQQANQGALEALFAGGDPARILEALRIDSRPFMLQVIASESDKSVSSVESILANLTQSLSDLDSQRFEQTLKALVATGATFGVSGDLTPTRQVFIARAIAQGAWRIAIEQISQIRFESRSSITHTQLVTALRGLSTRDWEIMLNPQIRPVLVRYVSKDEEFLSQWSATHRRLIFDLLEAESVDAAQRLARALQQEDMTVAHSVVPQVANAVVEGYLRRKDLQQAELALQELRAKPTLALRVRLIAARWGLSVVRVAVVLAIILAFIVLKLKLAQIIKGRGQTYRTTPDSTNHRAYITGAGESAANQNTTSFSEEYIEALRLFGLEPGATLTQIKNSYRSAVKNYHPDRSGGGANDDPTQFIRLTEEYEKLLRMHKNHGQSPCQS